MKPGNRAGDRDGEPEWSWISGCRDVVLTEMGWTETETNTERKRGVGVDRQINVRKRNEERRTAREDWS